MNIQTIPINQINPAPYNPRKDLTPDDEEFKQIENSIETFGCVELLVWNERTKTLVSGHQRLKVFIAKGFKEVDVSVVDLPIEKEKELNIALNKIRGQWDGEKLTALLRELTEVPEFDVSSIGFELPEVTALFDKYSEEKDGDDFDSQSEAENIEEAITQKGDLIVIGQHKLLCGDSSDMQSLERLFGDKKSDFIAH